LPRARHDSVSDGAIVGVFVIVGLFVLAGPGHAQQTNTAGVRLPSSPASAASTMSELMLPGGIKAALAVIDDVNPPDRSQFLLEIISRVHHLASPDATGSRDATLMALLTHLDARTARGAPEIGADTLPLPLTPAIWIDVVFGGRATPPTLASQILRSRGASLCYAGLLSLDDETRAFVAGQPGLLTELASRLAPAFALAAPGIRISGQRVAVPGGAPATAMWEALVGRRVDEPVEFVRALLAQDSAHLAWFYGALAPLTPAQLGLALGLDAPDDGSRLRRLYHVFVHVAGDWRIETRTFWRPALDPALFAGWLPVDASGRPTLPGSRGFWTAVFTGPTRAEAERVKAEDAPLDFVWLCERVFEGAAVDHRRRLQQVLFAARLPLPLSPAQAGNSVDAVRARAQYPALVAVLERLRITDVALVAQAARRAGALSAIDAAPRTVRALTQFQGLLSLVARTASRSPLAPDVASELVRSLVACELGAHGDYEGRLVHWLDAHLSALVASDASSHDRSPSVNASTENALERDVLIALAGHSPTAAPTFEWEGTRYRVDLAAAEETRLARLLGETSRPWLSSARTLVSLADTLDTAPLTAATRANAARTLAGIAGAVDWTDGAGWRDVETLARYTALSATLGRSDLTRTTGAGSRVAADLRLLADGLLARGLLELTYATALGQPERAWISADEASSGHDFGVGAVGNRYREAAWRRAAAGADARREWRATGSLLGLEVSLAELSLVRLSTRPPRRRPTLNEEDRRVIVENVALVDPGLLTDADLGRLAATIARGRALLAAMQSEADAATLAEAIRLGPARRTLFTWMLAHDRPRVTAFLSPLELLWLGLEGRPVDRAFDAWGAPAEAMSGCLCLRLPDPQRWEPFAGRWGTGLFASGFPDLNLRLAELLAAQQLPAALLGPVLAAAALDLVNTTASRGQDDRRSLVEFVQTITPERLEQYLALLTTDGPLVPMGSSEDAIATRSGVPR
jgi:hypothetical protein